MTGKKKRRPPTAEEMEQLAGASRDQAALAPPTFGPVTIEVDPEFAEIKATASIPEIIEAMRAYKKPKRMTTEEMITEVARCIAEGRPYWTVAKKFRPDLPLEKAKVYLRVRVNKKRKEVDAAVARLTKKNVTK
jgi:hypothetical protein